MSIPSTPSTRPSRRWPRLTSAALGGALACVASLIVVAARAPAAAPQDAGKPPADSERAVQEAEVPKAALDALRKLAGGAAITEFAEEIEHGLKYYEGTWAGANGKVDGLVTAAGDVVVVEEALAADGVPAVVRAAAAKEAGKDVAVTFEKKTVVMYEIHFRKDGKEREAVFLPDGRRFEEEGEEHGGDE